MGQGALAERTGEEGEGAQRTVPKGERGKSSQEQQRVEVAKSRGVLVEEASESDSPNWKRGFSHSHRRGLRFQISYDGRWKANLWVLRSTGRRFGTEGIRLGQDGHTH